MKQPSLFDPPYDVAVRDMVELFKRQLNDASTPLEVEEINMAIRSWLNALEPVKKAKRKPRKP